ncbi:MAG TPA: tetratricopeptide repeat protein [Candidatus Eisenbacteria bacterium]|nr:tetratricopeptide repeat protein [Candidatus Eisenbacteria bacterium]
MRRLAVALAITLSGCGHIVVLNDPLTAAEHNDLGVAYEQAGHKDLAAREYRKALKRDRHFAVARVNLGNLAAASGEWADAEKCYRRALRDRPDDADAMNNLATALLKRGKRLDEAEQLAARAVATGGRDSLYRATLAEVQSARSAAADRR